MTVPPAREMRPLMIVSDELLHHGLTSSRSNCSRSWGKYCGQTYVNCQNRKIRSFQSENPPVPPPFPTLSLTPDTRTAFSRFKEREDTKATLVHAPVPHQTRQQMNRECPSVVSGSASAPKSSTCSEISCLRWVDVCGDGHRTSANRGESRVF